jgi:hypothetical protein
MTTEEKIAFMRAIGNMSDEVRFKDAVLSAFLDMAADAIFDKMYPFGVPEDVTEVPDRYARKQCNIAVYLYNRQGSEGETYHSENGINRTYASANVPDDMLKGIVPIGKVLS